MRVVTFVPNDASLARKGRPDRRRGCSSSAVGTVGLRDVAIGNPNCPARHLKRTSAYPDLTNQRLACGQRLVRGHASRRPLRWSRDEQ